MGTNVYEADYENSMPQGAQSINEKGNTLKTEIQSAYEKVEGMHDSAWRGAKYNELVVAFNNTVDTMNNILNLVIGEIPNTLYEAANNYGKFDRGSGVGSLDVSLGQTYINTLTATTDTVLTFRSDLVTSAQSEITSHFSNAESLMDEIESVMNGVVWDSDAATAYKAKFKQLKSEVLSSFQTLRTKFTELMNETIAQAQQTESANTVQ